MIKRRGIALLLSVLLMLLLLPLGSATAANDIVQLDMDKNTFLGLFANDKKAYEGLSAAETGNATQTNVPDAQYIVSGGGMTGTITEENGGRLWQTSTDVGVEFPDNALCVAFTGTSVYSIALGAGATAANSTYLAGATLTITVNGTETFSHTTGATAADNDVIITSNTPITSIAIAKQADVTDMFPGLSYLGMAAEVALPETPELGAVDFDGTTYSIAVNSQSLGSEDTYYSIDDGTTWQTSSDFDGLTYDETLTLAVKFGTDGFPSMPFTTSVADFLTPLIGKIEEAEAATKDLEEGEGNGQYPSSVFTQVTDLTMLKELLLPEYTEAWIGPVTLGGRANGIAMIDDFLTELPDLQIQIDATALTNLIATAKGIDTDLYTAGSVTVLNGAIADAQALLLTPYTTDEVSDMVTTLQTAIDGLIQKGTLEVTYDASFGDTYAEVSFDKGATWVRAEGVLDIPESATEIWLRGYSADIYSDYGEDLEGLAFLGGDWIDRFSVLKYTPEAGDTFAGACKIAFSDAEKMENAYGALNVTYNEDGSITVRSSAEPEEAGGLVAVIVNHYLNLEEDIDYTDITASPYAVTLHKSFLDELADGEHAVQFLIFDGENFGHAAGSFTLGDEGGEDPSPSPSPTGSPSPSESPSGSPSDGSGKPATGDQSSTTLFIVVGALAVAGLAIVMIMQKKRRIEE